MSERPNLGQMIGEEIEKTPDSVKQAEEEAAKPVDERVAPESVQQRIARNVAEAAANAAPESGAQPVDLGRDFAKDAESSKQIAETSRDMARQIQLALEHGDDIAEQNMISKYMELADNAGTPRSVAVDSLKRQLEGIADSYEAVSTTMQQADLTKQSTELSLKAAKLTEMIAELDQYNKAA